MLAWSYPVDRPPHRRRRGDDRRRADRRGRRRPRRRAVRFAIWATSRCCPASSTPTRISNSAICATPLGRPGMPLIDWLPLAIAERQNRSHLGRASRSRSASRRACSPERARSAKSPPPTRPRIRADAEIALIAVSRSDRLLAGPGRVGVCGAVEERLARATSCVADCGVSPHAPYTVSPELLRIAGRPCARERNLPVAMHLAESAEELELLGRRHRAVSRFARSAQHVGPGGDSDRQSSRSTTCGCWPTPRGRW